MDKTEEKWEVQPDPQPRGLGDESEVATFTPTEFDPPSAWDVKTFRLSIVAYQDRTYRLLFERRGARSRFISEKGWWAKQEVLVAFDEAAGDLGSDVELDRRFPGE